MSEQASPLAVKSEAFSIRIVKMVQYLNLHCDRNMKPIYNQVLRSGTSISANLGEAQFAQTPADFLTKLYISLKEANETKKWIKLLKESSCLTETQYNSMLADLSELIAMLVSSIKTAKKNQTN